MMPVIAVTIRRRALDRRAKKVPFERGQPARFAVHWPHETGNPNYPLRTSVGKATPTGALRLFLYPGSGK
jgi:hypothetical protein